MPPASPGGGTGVAQAPAFGVGSTGPAPGAPQAPAPAVAPAPGSADPALLVSQGAPSPPAPGLAGPAPGRRLGLPVVLALVALVGAASLVLRALLAEPVQR